MNINLSRWDSSCPRCWEDPQQYKAPMPWIGVYVAAASLVCTLAMAADVFQGFRHKKLWFPCKFFTLNAAWLTLLSVAMKLPMDLTTTMLGVTDQLTKLSSTTFMCTVIGNFMPSLGSMDNKEIFMNVIALGILVITIIVNVCIQMGTGVIFNGVPIKMGHDASLILTPVVLVEQALLLFLMLVLFVLLSSTAFPVATTKKYIERNYEELKKEETKNFTHEKLKEEMRKFWVMAKTGNPQFVVARSVTCSASGIICYLTSLILMEAIIRFFWMNQYSVTREFGSDYKWSTLFIFLIQSTGVGVGTIAPTFRWFISVQFKLSEKGCRSYRTLFKIEHYWIENLVKWKEIPLAFPIRGKKSKNLIHDTRNLLLVLCIRVQIVIVVGSKLVLLISNFLIYPLLSCYEYFLLIANFLIHHLLSCYQYCTGFNRKVISGTSTSKNHSGLGHNTGKNLDLNHYVLNLEGDNELPQRILRNICDAVDHFIGMGNKQQPKYLIEILKKSTDFKGVTDFVSDQVPSINSAKPANCWSLSVVTLSSIAIALPNIETHLAKHLLQSVCEGLLYVRLVEKTLGPKGDLVNIGNAAEIVWLGVEVHHKWMNEDLKKIGKGKTSKETLQRFADIAMNNAMEFKGRMNIGLEDPFNWPIKVIANDSMHRISQTLLLNLEGRGNQTDEGLFEQLSIMVADILRACLTNLPRVITSNCFSITVEKGEESVQHAAHLLGETEEILKLLQQCELPPMDSDKVTFIDDWRALLM